MIHCWSAHEVLGNEDISLSKSMLDACSPNDDMWKKFITPPNSPRTLGESSESDESLEELDTSKRLQIVCENLDSNFDTCKPSPNFGSKLISDCMWSCSLPSADVSRRLLKEPTKKLCLESEDENLYPTPCPSPPPSSSELSCYHSDTECVNPTAVFPFSLKRDCCLTDTDEEVDVVTVDCKPHSANGHRRSKLNHTTPFILAKIGNDASNAFKKRKCLAAKLHNERLTQKSIDDVDPVAKRASHNVLERKRRVDLKKSFERLRESVPYLEREEKTPKVVVLKKASMHIMALIKEEKKLSEQKRLLLVEKENLMEKILKLTGP